MSETVDGTESEPRSPAAPKQRPGGSVRRVGALIEVIKMLAGQMQLDDLLSLLAVRTADIMKAERCIIYLIDEARQDLWSRVPKGLGSVEIRLKKGQGLAGHVWRNGWSVIVHDAHTDPRFDPHFDKLTGWTTRDVLAVPMRDYRDRAIGVFEVANRRRRHFSKKDEDILAGLASAAAIALESARLRYQASQDPLTGLRNRRGFQELYERELLKAKRDWRPMALIKLDVDNFESTSDTHGRAVGDEILRTVGRLMEKSFRTTDILARYGGDEFVALLPETDGRGASACVDRLKEMISRFNGQRTLPVPISMTAGIAAASSNHEKLLELADRAMDASKAAT